MKGIEGLNLGRYELRRRIAQGGTAEVYLGYDRRVRRQVAVKVLYGRDELFVRRFEREALAVGALAHNHILPLYDFGEQSPWYYLVMPYVDGCTLRDYLFQQKRLTLEEAASFLSQIASALQYAHEHGVVHRDVKPSNILLREDGYAYLVDFGLAKAMQGAESLTSAGAMVGTPEYMAPEQSNGMSDYRSDIYSLGIILYQMLTGQLPFIAESPVAVSLKHIQTVPVAPRTLNSAIPQSIEHVILTAMAKDPEQRYQEAKDLAAAFWKALQQEMFHEHMRDGSERVGHGDGNGPKPSKPAEQKTSTTVTQVAARGAKGAEIQLELRPPIVPLRCSLKERLGPLVSIPDTTSLPPEVGFSRRLRRIDKRTIVSMVCLLMFVLVLPLGMLTWQVQRTHVFRLHGSSTTPAQNVAATATATKEASLAAQARAEATAGITNSIGAGKVLYTNALTNPSGGWINDGSQCFFSPQGYHVHSLTAHEFAWCYSSQQTYGNIVISAQAQLIHGDVYGLVFCLNPNAQQFYALEMNRQGEYRFVLANGNDPSTWVTLIDWTRSNAISAGYHVSNTLQVVAANSTFRFYINKQLVMTGYSNTTYSVGMVGFLVGGDSAGGTEAVFKNMYIFQK